MGQRPRGPVLVVEDDAETREVRKGFDSPDVLLAAVGQALKPER